MIQAMLVYWNIANFFTLIQTLVFRSKRVRKLLAIPDPPPPPKGPLPGDEKGFWKSMKDSINSMQPPPPSAAAAARMKAANSDSVTTTVLKIDEKERLERIRAKRERRRRV
jgi:membrane protein insertase Oxa1/YidC/SpoIIIJ